MKDIAWVDTANQIDNSWYKRTVVGIFFEKSKRFDSIKIESKYKLKIVDKLKNYDESIVVGNLQAYLVYLCCLIPENILELETTFICSDFQPIRAYHKYLQKCFSYHGKSELFDQLKFKPNPKGIKSKAHRKTNQVYKGRKIPKLVFNHTNLNSFLAYFNKQSIRKKQKG